MKREITFQCVCGHEATVELPEKGKPFQCPKCGVQLLIEGDLADMGEMRVPLSSLPGSEKKKKPTHCPSCGAPLKISEAKGDKKIVSCTFCDTEVDVSDPKSSLLEQISELAQSGGGSFSMTVEPETVEPGGDALPSVVEGKTPGGTKYWMVGGRKFARKDDLKKHLLENFPKDVAEALLKGLG